MTVGRGRGSSCCVIVARGGAACRGSTGWIWVMSDGGESAAHQQMDRCCTRLAARQPAYTV